MSNFGSKLVELRTSHNLSQKQLAKHLGFSVNSIHKWEHEEIDPSFFNAICIADFFNISLDELAGRNVSKCDYKQYT